MAKYVVEFDIDNASFDPITSDTYHQIGVILEKIARGCRDWQPDQTIHDENGNKIGFAKIVD